MKDRLFGRFARATARSVGHPSTFVAALAIVLLWAVSGPWFHFSDTWQLVINTGTTVITFLMVFVIQQTQNRDSEAMHLKLDEIIRALRHAHNELIDIEDLSEEELDALRHDYTVLAQRSREQHAHTTARPHGPSTTAQDLRRAASIARALRESQQNGRKSRGS